MTYTHIPLEDFLKNISVPNPSKEELREFDSHLEKYFKNFDESNEAQMRQNLCNLLRDSFDYSVKVEQDKIDLSIVDSDEMKVICEIKAFNNKADFIANGGALKDTCKPSKNTSITLLNSPLA